VAAEVQHREIPGVRVVISQGEPIGLLDVWAGVRLAVMIDAAVCEPSTPSRFHRRVVDRMPEQLIIYTVEVLDVSLGLGLSSAVAATLPIVVDAVAGELDRMRAA
jgi:hydrogenase maturation protease